MNDPRKKSGGNVIAFPTKERLSDRPIAAVRTSAVVPRHLDADVQESVAHIADIIWEEARILTSGIDVPSLARLLAQTASTVIHSEAREEGPSAA